MISVHIYVLTDPLTSEVRYVGLTRDVNKRLGRYGRPHTKHLANWFQSIKNKGGTPQLTVIETVIEAESSECERKWIRHYRDQGCRLLNYTDGGERGYAITDEYRKHLSESQTGKKKGPLSAAHKATLSLANKGRLFNPRAAELCRKNHEALRGVPLTAEHRRKVSEGVRRSMTPEVRKKMSESHKGKRPYLMTDAIRRKISEAITLWNAKRRGVVKES